ncbi:MAG: hypothetical protein HY872_05600 [Chloroflexi bacterium]|nr:hypothetical protein [Chloroflexota bacterium]
MKDSKESRTTPAYTAVMKAFPTISDEKRREMLAPPEGPVRVVIDTDAKNEIDDQFALTWALLSADIIQLEGVYAAPFSFGLYHEGLLRAYKIRGSGLQPQVEDAALLEEYATRLDRLASAGVHPKDVHYDPPGVGMERSYEEILTIFDKLGKIPDSLVFRGSDRFLSSVTEPVPSPAARHLIARARQTADKPLYVVAIGAITNVVSAMLLDPDIIRNIVVVWTSSYPSVSTRPTHSLNLEQDLLGSQLLFDSGVPVVYLPGYQVGAQLRISQPEMEMWVRGKGAIGDYLYWLYTNNPLHAYRSAADYFGRSWIMWDLINIAWLLNPRWAPSELMPTPILTDDKHWRQGDADRHVMREAYGVDRDGIYRDFLTKLQRNAA